MDLDTLELAGPRLRLRPWRPSDAPRIVEALADPAIHEFIALPRPYEESDALTFIRDSGTPAAPGPKGSVWSARWWSKRPIA